MQASTSSNKKQSKKVEEAAGEVMEKPVSPSEDYALGTVLFCASSKPDLSRRVEIYLQKHSAVSGKLRYNINKAAEKANSPHLPTMLPSPPFALASTGFLVGDFSIARYLARIGVVVGLYGTDHGDDTSEPSFWQTTQVDQWLDLCQSHAAGGEAAKERFISILEGYLSERTFLVGQQLTLADLAAHQLLYASSASSAAVALALGGGSVNIQRWFSLIGALSPVDPPTTLSPPIPATAALMVGATAAAPKTAANCAASKATASSSSACATSSSSSSAGAAAADGDSSGDSGACPPLQDAVEGAVCTRFPPEPSGYLHIGHAKAVLLNQYYAQRYKGRLLVRFDDTNPSKEKEEFEENIIHDLATLGVKADKVSHSSDHFSVCEEFARKMIKEGKAYMDDTDQETMQAERMARTESKHRDSDPAVNLTVFEQLLLGEPAAQKFCLRAKIDMASLNGTLRDPVLYRFNDTPHHRTGTKHKAYPTYDFACPIIDSIEGVTHALRTTEYNDRDEQYHWLQDALALRTVHIQAFGKMNFVHTVLSKRKLNWFVEQGLVEGWFDPRFPTIQGCVRRGMNVEALKSFIISQGASRRVITMEWDKFWSENKRVLEERSARYMGVTLTGAVEMTLLNVDSTQVTAHSVQVHPQKPEMGRRVMRRFHKVLIDQIDAATFKVGEEVTLLRWGNVKLTAIKADPSGAVLSIEGEYDASATNFSKTKKITWVASIPDLVPCTLVEFDHLISKAKLGDEEKFQDFINPVTKVESAALCDPCLRTVQAGEVIQLERKGFYRCDQPYGGKDKPAVLFFIPDGKAKPSATAAAAVTATVTAGKKKQK